MHPTISDAYMRARVAELQGRTVSFRYAEPGDRESLERLAALDTAAPLARPLLVAELDHAMVAAIGTGGEVIADPFVPTSRLVRRLRALHETEAQRGLRGRIRARFAPS
jgi:hypothetical protein